MDAASEAVAAYLPLIEKLAHRRVGVNGAEFDDLRQEGMIAVWQSLDRGQPPSAAYIEGRQRNWTTFLGRQLPTDYERILPLEVLETERYAGFTE